MKNEDDLINENDQANVLQANEETENKLNKTTNVTTNKDLDNSSEVIEIQEKKNHTPLIVTAIILCILLISTLIIIQYKHKNDNDNNSGDSNVTSTQSSAPSSTPASTPESTPTSAPTNSPDNTPTSTPPTSTPAAKSDNNASPLSEQLSGEWHRTEVHSSNAATIKISNVSEKGFHINVDANDGASIGTLEADATFDSTGNAVAKFTSASEHVTDINFVFSKNKDSFTVEYDLDNSELDFGVGVTMSGLYIKTEPMYTNAYILDSTFTPEQKSKIKKLIGDSNYNEYFIPYMNDGFVSNGVTTDGLSGRVVLVSMKHMAQEDFEVLIGDNHYIYFISDSIGYFSDDPDNSKTPPKHTIKLDEE